MRRFPAYTLVRRLWWQTADAAALRGPVCALGFGQASSVSNVLANPSADQVQHSRRRAVQAAAGTASGMAGAVVGEMRPHTQPAAEQPRTQQAEKRGGEQVDIAEFHRMSDIYLGGLWNRFEAELRRNEGENFDYDVQLTSGCMRVKLPDDAEIVICKEPGERALVVESNLHCEGPDPRDTAAFKLDDDADEFTEGSSGTPLHSYLEEHLQKHLQVKLDLEPQLGAHAKVYGPDPT